MKTYLIFGILLFIINSKKTNASKIAEHFEISTRTVYRYLDSLLMAEIPIITKVGRYGGIEIEHDFCLNSLFLSNEEKDILKNALILFNSPKTDSLIEKLCL